MLPAPAGLIKQPQPADIKLIARLPGMSMHDAQVDGHHRRKRKGSSVDSLSDHEDGVLKDPEQLKKARNKRAAEKYRFG